MRCSIAMQVARRVLGTKERSVINSASRAGIAAVVAQQFELAMQVLAHGLMPIIEPEVNIKSETRSERDAILLDELTKALDALPRGTEGHAQALAAAAAGPVCAADHASAAVLRVVALRVATAGAMRWSKLRTNHGVIASFSRALLEDHASS